MHVDVRVTSFGVHGVHGLDEQRSHQTELHTDTEETPSLYLSATQAEPSATLRTVHMPLQYLQTQ